MSLIFRAEITDIFERKIQKHLGGSGPAATFSTASIGWYIQLDGMISFFVGDARPQFTVGDNVTISMRKTDANTN